MEFGEEVRVGAGLAESYPITWCAVEYFETSGAILNMLLQHLPPSDIHLGRTLLHHAILCGNLFAVKMLLKSGHYHVEDPVKTTKAIDIRPIHLASRLGFPAIVQHLIEAGCDLNSQTNAGETALMICAKYRTEESLKVLARAGADFGLVNFAGQSVSSIAASNKWHFGFQQAVLDVIRDGKFPKSSNLPIFSPLMFVAQAGDVLALKALIGREDINIDAQDDRGFSAVMVAAEEGHVEAFRILVYAGADIKLCNKSGETAIALSQLNKKRELFAKVILEFALENSNHKAGWLYALHFAARHGDLSAVKLLIGRGYDVNMIDGDGYTPLMLAAIEGYAHVCQLLISYGANCNMRNAEGETALSLARKTGGIENDVENVILDELARKLVVSGSRVLKHTKGGKGAPHMKVLKMMGAGGVLHWGNSWRRNVICQEANLGASLRFQRIRHRKGDADEPGLFRVTTTRNKEVHFVCDGGSEMAQLWVRGIKLLTADAYLDR